MSKWTITVSNVSSFVLEASSEEEALDKANRLLDDGDGDTMGWIDEYSSGWNITDVEDE